jgi:spore cortex formation protein SpoVR/YcgB (stage V sporulation)
LYDNHKQGDDKNFELIESNLKQIEALPKQQRVDFHCYTVHVVSRNEAQNAHP